MSSDYDRELAAYTHRLRASIEWTIDSGGTAYLYTSVHVEVDSLLDIVESPGGLSVYHLAEFGAQGWESVGVVPRTYSGSSVYKSKNKRTGGPLGGGYTMQQVSLSGNVVGAYVILRLPITFETRQARDGLIDEIAKRNFEAEFGPRA